MLKSFIFSYPFNGDIQGILDILQSPRIQEIYAPLENPFLGTPRVTRYTPSKDYILKLEQILDKSKKNLNSHIDSLSRPASSKNKDLNLLRTAQTNGAIK